MDTCVVFCTGSVDDDVHHLCWCQDGRMSYDEFASAHPEWVLLDAYDWLGVTQGREWRKAMER